MSGLARDYLRTVTRHSVPFRTGVYPLGRDGSRRRLPGQPEVVVETFDRKYAGYELEVPGGPLEGVLTLGASPSYAVNRNSGSARWDYTTDGLAMIRAAGHDTAQCALVLSQYGAVGTSWTDEFLELYESAEQMIEMITRWQLVRRWQYVSVTRADAAQVADLARRLDVDLMVGGAAVQWWSRPDLAVAVERTFTSHPGDPSLVHVIARTDELRVGARRRLASGGRSRDGFATADSWGRVGEWESSR